MLRFLGLFGRRTALLLLHPISFYFWVSDSGARRASAAYFERLVSTPEGRRALGHEPGWRDGYRHIHEFAISIFDRLCVWAGLGDLVIDHEGSGHFAHLPDAAAGENANALGKCGALIVGAHVGNFDMMRAASMGEQVPVHVVMYGANARTINGFSVAAALEIRAAIQRSDFVAIMGDRAGLTSDARHLALFLGAPARFGAGPFELAATLGCPLMMATTLRTDDGHYQVRSWPIYPGGHVPRGERSEVVQRMIETYAAILKTAVLEAPYQWFNFFDFWKNEEDTRG